MASIASNDEDTEVETYELELSYAELSKAFDELLNDS